MSQDDFDEQSLTWEDVGNNDLKDLYSIYALKDLPRLIILDLNGNTACNLSNYRSFTIYYLSRLKVLKYCFDSLDNHGK